MVAGASPVQAQSRVGVELADDAVGSGAEGDGQDDANGEQLDGDLLEGTDALGDGVGCGWALLALLRIVEVVRTNRSAPPSATVLALAWAMLDPAFLQERETSSWERTGGAGRGRAAGRGKQGRRAA